MGGGGGWEEEVGGENNYCLVWRGVRIIMTAAATEGVMGGAKVQRGEVCE